MSTAICDACGGVLHPDDTLVPIPGIGFMHVLCPSAQTVAPVRFEAPPPDEGMQEALDRIVTAALDRAAQTKEEGLAALLAAYLAETGYKPSQVVLCSQDAFRDGQYVTLLWFEPKPGPQP